MTGGGYRDPASGRTYMPRDGVSVTKLARNPAVLDRILAAQLDLARQALADACGFHTAEGLYDGDRRLAARLVEGRYGWSWLLRYDEVERYGRKWVPYAGASPSRVQEKLKLTERLETCQAQAVIAADRFGTDHVRFERTGDKWGLDSRLKPEAT
jgi:hypothetical protein